MWVYNEIIMSMIEIILMFIIILLRIIMIMENKSRRAR